MRVFKQLLFGTCIFALSFILTPGAKATVWNQKVVATFNAPVEIPGQILPSGTYVFKVVDIVGSRDIVQVTNSDESRVLSTAITVTRYRTNPTDKPVFVFEERGINSPQALQAWYYPGYTGGHQFIYSGAIAPQPMTASSTSAPEVPASTTANPSSEESSPVMSADAETNQPIAETTSQSTQSTDQTTAPTQTTPTTTDQPDKELPKTASSTPLVALIGMLLMAGAFGLKLLVSRVS